MNTKKLFRLNKIVFWLSLCGGLLILLIGVLLYLAGQEANGFTFTKSGNVQSGTITGPSGICLGILMLVFAFWNFKNWKEVEKDRAKRIHEEKPIKKMGIRERNRLSQQRK